MIGLEVIVLVLSKDNVQQGRPSQMRASFSLGTDSSQGDGDGRDGTLCVLTPPSFSLTSIISVGRG